MNLFDIACLVLDHAISPRVSVGSCTKIVLLLVGILSGYGSAAAGCPGDGWYNETVSIGARSYEVVYYWDEAGREMRITKMFENSGGDLSGLNITDVLGNLFAKLMEKHANNGCGDSLLDLLCSAPNQCETGVCTVRVARCWMQCQSVGGLQRYEECNVNGSDYCIRRYTISCGSYGGYVKFEPLWCWTDTFGTGCVSESNDPLPCPGGGGYLFGFCNLDLCTTTTFP